MNAMADLALPSAIPAPTQATVLVVDADGTSRRFVELALGRTGFNVESARDTAAALEILKAQVVDLIVCDTELADGSGLAFQQRLRQESRLRGVPFLFLSADASVDTKVAALRAGADDYLVKPCPIAELVARVEAQTSRARRQRDARRARTYSLAGDLSAMAFPEIVSILEMGRRSGVLSIVTSRSQGHVDFDDGSVVHAVYGSAIGERAFQLLFNEPEGHFEFTPQPCVLPREQRTIAGSVTALVMEAARVYDTERASGPLSAYAPIERPRKRLTVPPPAVHLLPASRPDALIAAQFELALRDPYALGELHVFSHGDLARWTRREAFRDRFHVLLVADLSAGVSSILSFSGAPTERCIEDALGEGPKTLGLTLHLRHERMIDVVLVDAARPAALLPSLGRAPSAIVLAPPDGDLLSLGTAARVALEELLEVMEPPAVVAVGNASLEGSLSRMRAFHEGPSTLRCVTGALGEDTCDLRGLLVKSARLWASTEPVTSRERH